MNIVEQLRSLTGELLPSPPEGIGAAMNYGQVDRARTRVIRAGNGLYAVCQQCRNVVKLNKPIFGSLHVCEPDDPLLPNLPLHVPTRPLYWRRDGTPYVGPNAVLQWARDYEDFEANRRVAQTMIYRRTTKSWYRISTVFLGLDHSWGEGPPMIFESMVFGGEDADEYAQQRYSTEAQALAGHDALCKEYVNRR